MVAMQNTIFENLVPGYDDGAGWPNATCEKEQAFRQGFLEEARRIARQWAHPADLEPIAAKSDPIAAFIKRVMADPRFDPFQEVEAAARLRNHLRERYTVYGPGITGRKAFHLGYRAGHEVPAARLRGRHHAMVYVVEPWEHAEDADVDVFDPQRLSRWLQAVEAWADSPIQPESPCPPPRLLEVRRSDNDDGATR